MQDEAGTPEVIPRWVKGVAKYALGLLPVLLAFLISVHDLQRDFEGSKREVVELTARVKVLEEKRAVAAVDQASIHTELSTKLDYTKSALDRLNETLDRMAREK